MTTLENLCKRDDIFITQGDRGGVMIIVNVHNYVDNRELYKKILSNATNINQIKVNRTINKLKAWHLLDQKTVEDVISLKTKTP